MITTRRAAAKGTYQMKKSILVTLSALLLTASLLCSCGESAPLISDAPPPDSTVYSFDSYDELTGALAGSNEKGETLREERPHYGNEYSKLLDCLSDTKNLRIPMLGGEKLPLRNEKGYHSIALFTKELYGLPWLWYYCVCAGSDVTIKLLYMSSAGDISVTPELSCSEVLKRIYPDAPNTDNYTSFSSYKNVYQTDIMLSDRTVSALVYEFSDSSSVTASFIYDDIFVSVKAESVVLTDGFWSGFSLGGA